MGRTGATGGRPTAPPCWWPGWTRPRSSAGTSPTRPTRPGPPPSRYPAAGTPNADVSLLLVRAGRQRTPVGWDRAAFPYLVTPGTGHGADPLIVVQSRDQRRMRLLAADPATGATTVLREDTDPPGWTSCPGVPARTGRRPDRLDRRRRRRRAAAGREPGRARGGSARPGHTGGPAGPGGADVDGDTVLFTASADEPTEIGLWIYGPGGLARLIPRRRGGDGTLRRRAGGTTVTQPQVAGQDGAASRCRAIGRGSADATCRHRLAGRAAPPARPAAGHLRGRAARHPHRAAAAVLARARLAEAAGAARPVRRPARPAGAGRRGRAS